MRRHPCLFRLLRLLVLLLAGPLHTPALAKDVPGASDHPLVGRYEGAQITLFEVKAFDEQRLIRGPVDQKAEGESFTDANSLRLEGKVTRIRYDAPTGRSGLEILRNYQDSLTAKGFTILYTCSNQSCLKSGGSPYRLSGFAGDGAINYRYGTGVHYLLARLERPAGNVYAGIYVGESRGAPLVRVIAVEEKPIETGRIAFVDAVAMAKALTRDGRVALYGISFEFDRADITPQSRETLDEIVKFLKANPAVAVIVTGHTDGQGGFDYNLDLSRRRAAAVVAALAARGIAGGRLTPFGAGMAAPIASNDDEEGRARNRRVELVKK